MKKTIVIEFVLMLLCLASCTDANMSKDADGNYVVNTTELCKDVQGYAGATPLNVYIKDDVIVKVEALENNETPSYFSNVQHKMFPKYEGLSVDEVDNIDGVTGATFSSNAIKKNVKTAVEYYKSKK